jgi:hypothetical protein
LVENNNEYWPWESRPVGDLLDGGSLVAEFCEDFLCRCEDAAHVSRTDLRLRGTVTLRERGLAVHYDLLEKSLDQLVKILESGTKQNRKTTNTRNHESQSRTDPDEPQRRHFDVSGGNHLPGAE